MIGVLAVGGLVGDELDDALDDALDDGSVMGVFVAETMGAVDVTKGAGVDVGAA